MHVEPHSSITALRHDKTAFRPECPLSFRTAAFRVPSSTCWWRQARRETSPKVPLGGTLLLPPPQRRRRRRPKQAGHVTLRGKYLLGQEALQRGHLVTCGQLTAGNPE